MPQDRVAPTGLRAGSHCPDCYQRYENNECGCTGFSTKLIGFCGPASSGKTLAAEHLIKAWKFRRVRFAGPLKAMMRALGLTEAQVDGAEKERPCSLLNGMTPRMAMQLLGTEWGRELVHSELWISAWAQAIATSPLPGIDLVVCDDVRFANEARAIRERGGIVVRIDRPGACSSSGADHASERLDFEPDFTIHNNGSRARYLAHIDRIVDMMREGSFDE